MCELARGTTMRSTTNAAGKLRRRGECGLGSASRAKAWQGGEGGPVLSALRSPKDM